MRPTVGEVGRGARLRKSTKFDQPTVNNQSFAEKPLFHFYCIPQGGTKMPRKLSSFEAQVLEKIFETEGLPLAAALPGTRIYSENYTGGGKCLNFIEEDEAEGKELEIINTKVSCETPALRNGAGFLLYLHQGQLFCLECFSYGETYPEGDFAFTLIS
ncbi:MAG: hypothetical protein AB3N24_18050 [Leisingera sp.]